MRVGLIDIDSRIPNLALMKLSAYYGGELTTPLFADQYDKVFASQVFRWTKTPIFEGELGGSGVNVKVLPDEVEEICPDYGLYGTDYSMGFLTRGCPNKCGWCVVPEKEGGIRAASDIEEFLRHDTVVLLDNNVLAHEHGLEQIEKMAKMGVGVDFNQGLDARLIDNEIAKLLGGIRWTKGIRLACDSRGMMEPVRKAVECLRRYFKPRISCYVLVKDVEDALERVEFLRGLKVDPFAQPYQAEGVVVTGYQKKFARWVNHKAMFKSVAWSNCR